MPPLARTRAAWSRRWLRVRLSHHYLICQVLIVRSCKNSGIPSIVRRERTTKTPAGRPRSGTTRGGACCSRRRGRSRSRSPNSSSSAGFPLTWLDVLAQLYDARDEGLRMQELEQRSLFTRSGLTRLVDRIEAAGLVRREAVPGDRRGVRVVLTSRGPPASRRGLRRPPQGHRARVRSPPDRRPATGRGRALATFWHDDRSADDDSARRPRSGSGWEVRANTDAQAARSP